jgi:hypothetical protein
MSTLDRIIGAIQDILAIKAEVARLAGYQERIVGQLANHEGRLVALERLIAASLPRLPK